jgi:hypothetical protein
MRRILVLVLMFVLMGGLVAGAGYSITVPTASTVPTVSTTTTTSGGGGGGGFYNATNNTTVGDDVNEGDVEEDSGDGVISERVEKITELVKGFGWETVLIVLGVLVVIGGTVWYVLIDRRKKFVEIKVRKK